MSMETLASIIGAIGSLIATTAAFGTVIYIAFIYRLPEKKKKWKQCPHCKKWKEVT